VVFVAVAIGWTWSFLLAAVALGASAGQPLHLVGLLGPVVAVLVAVRRAEPAYRRALARRVLDPRGVAPRWWLAVLAVGILPGVVGALASGPGGALTGGLPAAGALAGAGAFAVAAGLAEEPGWRGLAPDVLAPRLGVLRAGVALGALWSSWHLPLYLLDGTYQAGLGVGTADFWAAVAGPVPLAVLLLWLVRGAGGIVLPAVAAHALGNLTGEVLEETATGRWAQVVALAAGALLVARGEQRRRQARACSMLEI
jgi:uncharacterized protein